MKKFILLLLLSGLLVVSAITIPGCSEKVLPPVFKDARFFADHIPGLVTVPKIYDNISPQPEVPRIKYANDELDLPETPQTLATYRIIRPKVDKDFATRIADRLGFSGEPEERHNSVFPLNGFSFRNGEQVLYVSEDGSIDVIYVIEPGRPSSLPSDEECTTIAKKWLEDHGIYPVNIIGISVSPNVVVAGHPGGEVHEQWTQNKNVTFKMGLGGYELLGMGANVAIGENGKVLRVYVNAPGFRMYTNVGVRRPQAALDTFVEYLHYPELFYADMPKCLVDNVGSEMRVTAITIKYFCMLTEENAAPAYAQPIYVLDGYYKVGQNQSSFNARVDAVIR